MDHLLPLPDGLLTQLEAHCIPFREEFYECRIDGGDRHDPIVDQYSQLTHGAILMVNSNEACRQWVSLEQFLLTCRPRKNQQSGISGDPMVLRPRAFGKSLSAEVLFKTLAAVALTPFARAERDSVLGDVGVKLRPSSIGDIWERHFGSEHNRFRIFDEGHHWPAHDTRIRPDTSNTTDYPLPRGGKRIPKHGEKQCGPSNKLLSLMGRLTD